MSPPLKARLTLESLDARVVPANLGWTNLTGDGLADTPANWRNLDTQQVSTLPPQQNDSLTFDATLPNAPLANTPCSGLHGFNLPDSVADFAGIQLVGGYSATVTFAADATPGLSTVTFTLLSGAIAQPGITPPPPGPGFAAQAGATTGGTDLSVLGAFHWSGGTLNNSSYPATVHLLGATATINPGAGLTITTGSTISLESRVVGGSPQGSTATILPGEIDFVGGEGVVLNEFCNLFVRPTHDAIVRTKGIGIQDKTILVKANSTLDVGNNAPASGRALWDGWGMKLKVEGGAANFGVFLDATFGPAVAAQNPVATIRLSGGRILLTAGSTLSANPTNNGYTEMIGGEFLIVLPTEPNTAPAELIGNLDFTGGKIYFDEFNSAYWTFKVTGNVTWTGGTYHYSAALDDASMPPSLV